MQDRSDPQQVDTVHPGQAAIHHSALLRIVQPSGTSVIYQDPSLRVVWACNMPAIFDSTVKAGAVDDDFLPKNRVEDIRQLKQLALKQGQPQRSQLVFGKNAETRTRFDLWIDSDRDEDGTALGLLTTLIDTTRQWQKEQAFKALLRDVSHRSKNLLAIVQSIASQTARHTGSIDSFLASFRGRLYSLAASQDLVTVSDWRGAAFRELARSQITRYCADPATAIHFEGPDPYLNPNAALHVGLAIHELAVNSSSYGALAKGMPVELSVQTPEPSTYVITWSEAIDHAQVDLSTKHFGGLALEKIVPTSLDGSSSWSVNGGQLIYALTVPLSTLTHR